MEFVEKSHTDALILARNLRLLDDERIGRERRMARRAIRARRRRQSYNATWWLEPMVWLVMISALVGFVGWTWPELGMLLWQQ